MPPSGDSRPRRIPPIPGRHRTVSTRRSPCARPLPRCPLVHSRTHSGTQRAATPRPRPASPNVRAGPACEPASPSYAGPTTSAKPTRRTSTDCSTLIPVSEPRENALFKSSTSYTKPTTRTGPTRRSDGSPTSTPPARHREYHQAVDTIIAWGEQILAYHTTRRVSNGPIEGTNNLHPSPTTRRPRVHQPQQLCRPRNPRNMTPHRALAQPKPTFSRSLGNGVTARSLTARKDVCDR